MVEVISALIVQILTGTKHIGEQRKLSGVVAYLMYLVRALKERGLENE